MAAGGQQSAATAGPLAAGQPTAPPAPTPQVNLALRSLPRFACLPDDHGQHRTTTHLLPGDEGTVLAECQRAYDDARTGRLPDHPTIEVYWQTTVDPSLTGAQAPPAERALPAAPAAPAAASLLLPRAILC